MDEENKELETLRFFKTHKDKIYPWVKLRIKDDNDTDPSPIIKLSEDDSPIFKNWLDDLIFLYVVDMGDRFQILMKRDLPKFVSIEELDELATTNLDRDVEYTLNVTNFGGYGLIAGGNHEAGAISLPGMWVWLANHLNDNLIVAIPARDMIMMVPENDTDKISELKIFVNQLFKEGEKLLTKNIFRYDKYSAEWTIVDKVTSVPS